MGFTNVKSSRFPGFGQLTREQRLEIVARFCGNSIHKLETTLKSGSSVEASFIENYIGCTTLPIGIAPNFKINGKDYLVPMAIEESSVVAAAAYGAKLTYETGGLVSELKENLMIGQIQFVLDEGCSCEQVRDLIAQEEEDLIQRLNHAIPRLVNRGGGVRTLYVRGPYAFREVSFVIVQFDVDVKDAMGANTVNSLSEYLGELLEDLVKGRAHTKILSNLASKRVVHVKTRINLASLGSQNMWDEIAHRLHLTQGFAEVDPFRATTHNKGIMNGVDAVLVATGNDWRANEAGAHVFAALGGGVCPLSHWHVNPPFVYGEMQIPMQVGVVGGVTRLHPVARLCLDIMDIQSGQELAEVAAAVGLAQNFSAIRALAFEGIQEGHMKLHESNLQLHQMGELT